MQEGALTSWTQILPIFFALASCTIIDVTN